MSQKLRWRLRLSLAVILGLVAVQQLYRHGWDYVFAERFLAIEPGRIYRSAWLKAWPFDRVVDDHEIRTVIALAHPPDHPLVQQESQAADERGIDWIHLPIVDDRRALNGLTVDDQLDRAVAILADADRHPVLFHCHHGVNRASMVQIAYRTKHCGWTLEEATAEVAETFGLPTVEDGPDYRHMVRYYQTRVLPSRESQRVSLKGSSSLPQNQGHQR